MASLKLRRIDGSTEVIELSRSQPLTIGGKPFNDVCVAEEGVARLHCRISWNKTGFEVTAASPSGVDVNSNSVAHHNLAVGDTIRVGSLDLVFQDDAANPVSPSPDLPPASPSSPKPKKKDEPPKKPAADMSFFEGDILTVSQAMMSANYDDGEDPDADDFAWSDRKKREAKAKPAVGLVQQVRPGDQEILKSPLVLGLTGGGLALLLITGIFWFLISREQTNRMYDRAIREMNDGQYAQAITSFERFIQQNPSHGLRRLADRGLANTLVRKEISGAAPSWKRGLERLNELIKAHRNDSDFSDLHSTLFQFAEQISLGSAKSAETSHDPDLLVISKDAQTLLERFADPSAPPAGTVARINDQRVKAERAIEKQKTFDLAMKAVDMAIANRKPMLALSERERLVKAFPDFVNSKRVRESLQKSLDLEQSVVSVDESEQPAETTEDAPPTKEPILGLLQARSRTDEASQGRTVFVMAKESCFAIDTVTGELIWRRIVGGNSPFFPKLTTGVQPSLLLFDSRHQALVACQVANGKLIWKQPLKARAISGPLVHEGQIYLPLEGNTLVRIDVDTGRLSARVRFSQDLAATPALTRDGNYLLVPGQMAMIYTLALHTTGTRRPLTPVATTFTDHAAGSVSAPPLSMGTLLLVCENDRADSARLRLWDASKPTESLIELASSRTAGQVRDVPVIRGKQLVVPSAGEHFAAFAVTDEPGQASIAAIGEYRAEQARAANRLDSPLFVVLGPDQQFWSAGSAFRRFEIGSNNIRMESNSTAPGIASQPLQMIGDYFYVGRKSRYCDAVTFSAVEREKLINPWRIIVGDAPLELLPTRDGGLVWVGESGSLYFVGKNRLSSGGFDFKAGTDLELPPNVSKPIRATALHDQRLVVAAAGETVQLFVLQSSGQVAATYQLTELPETDPVLIDEGLVLPLPGRLKLLPLTQGKKLAQDWIAPVGEKQEHHWSQLIRVDGRELLACESDGRVMRIQYREGDVPHLAEVAKIQLEHPLDVRPVVRGEYLYVADTKGTCRQLNVSSFDTDGQRVLAQPIKNLWSVGLSTIVHAGDHLLHCLSDGKELPELWAFDLKDLEPVGQPLLNGESVWVACRNGVILVLNAKTGAELRRIVLPQSLGLGLRHVNEAVIAIATDGTIYRVE